MSRPTGTATLKLGHAQTEVGAKSSADREEEEGCIFQIAQTKIPFHLALSNQKFTIRPKDSHPESSSHVKLQAQGFQSAANSNCEAQSSLQKEAACDKAADESFPRKCPLWFSKQMKVQTEHALIAHQMAMGT